MIPSYTTTRGTRQARTLIALAIAGAVVALPPVTGDAYVLLSAKWPVRSVPYYVNAANLDVDQNAAILAVQAAASAWTQQSAADFRFVYAGTTTGASATYNAKNEVFFRNSSSGSAIATTYWWSSNGQIVDTDMVFWDGAFKFFTGSSGCASGFFIEDVGTHEFGHALGLGHSSSASATMYSSTSGCNQSLRSLDADDIAGVEVLYPSGSAQPPSAPTTLTAKVDASSPSTATLLTWTDTASNENAMLVERRVGGTSTWTQIASLAVNASSHRDSGLTPGGSYDYRVRASNVAGFSGYTNVAGVTTSASTTPPVAAPSTPASPSPSNGATRTAPGSDLFWTAAGATSYDVYFGTSATPPLYASGIASASLVLPRLSRGTTYYWRVVAKNTGGSASGPVWSFRTR